MKKINFTLTLTSFFLVFVLGYFAIYRPMKINDFDTAHAELAKIQSDISYWQTINDRFNGELLTNNELKEYIPQNYEGRITWQAHAEKVLVGTTYDANRIRITDTKQKSLLISGVYEIRIEVEVTLGADSNALRTLIANTYKSKPLMLIRELSVTSNNQISIEFIGFYS